MSYIETIHEADAEGKLAALYQRYGNGDGTVDNVLKVHSLNPETLETHGGLYVQAMHHPGPLSRIEREIIAVTVSRVNGCGYCVQHHATGLRRLLPENRKAVAASVAGGDESELTEREAALAAYAAKLAQKPDAMTAHDVDALRAVGLEDREILDVVQIASYFAYANRVALGLGVALEGDDTKVGRWPGE